MGINQVSTRMIKTLEENGLIEKKSDVDKRLVKIFLTNKGKKIRLRRKTLFCLLILKFKRK